MKKIRRGEGVVGEAGFSISVGCVGRVLVLLANVKAINELLVLFQALLLHMAEAIAAGAGVAAAIIQAKTALWQPLKQTIASSNDMDKIYGALDDAI
ncbi:hypothetical protein L2E82_36564 [Cichorium intybus]|uniref:Uncharacterized protein n=1 Tax=Cichorium intybus TaxID=13427 RepID=A0ACB9ADF1_CICIN|nr:hypothetical protein L2E82_36564 [Cichorium intybus]